MTKYNIYAGLNGGFGGANLVDTFECDSQEEANQIAYDLACEIFDNHAGGNGLEGWDDCQKEAEQCVDRDLYDDEDMYQEELDLCAEEIYNEVRENWISYYAKEVEDE